MTISTKPRSIELEALRIEMLRQKISVEELAERINRSPVTVRNVLSGDNKARRAQLAVEKALGVKIWTRSKLVFSETSLIRRKKPNE